MVNRSIVNKSFVSRIKKFFTRSEQFYDEAVLFDILLHREKDLETTVKWLTENKIEIINAKYQKIRICIKPTEFLLAKIAAYKFVKAFEQYENPSFRNNEASRI